MYTSSFRSCLGSELFLPERLACIGSNLFLPERLVATVGFGPAMLKATQARNILERAKVEAMDRGQRPAKPNASSRHVG